jgi:hypothetical protein
MPGGLQYKMHLVWEKLMSYWYVGSFAQFEYNLKESDKYLVEAKTLFAYSQYLLGMQALMKSNEYFSKVNPQLQAARKEGKDISQKQQILKEAAAKHTEVLEKMIGETPEHVIWDPEKQAASYLPIHDLIYQSLNLRRHYL